MKRQSESKSSYMQCLVRIPNPEGTIAFTIFNRSVADVELIDEITEDEDDVNAVGRRFNRGNRKFRPQQGQTQKPPFKKQGQQNPRPPNPSFTPTFSEPRLHKGKPTVKPANLCRWHTQFGKEAFTCEAGCDKFQGSKTGKAQAGRHT